MIIIGIVGGIATGKSTLCEMQFTSNMGIINGDKMAHKTYEKGTKCYNEIKRIWGNEVIDNNGEINRKALGKIVFSSPHQMNILKSITWPETRKLIELELIKMKNEGIELVLLEAAILIEAGWSDLVDEIWLLAVSEDIAIERLKNRNNFNKEESLKRIRAQNFESRVEYADVIIWNNGTIEEFEAKIIKAYYDIQVRLDNNKKLKKYCIGLNIFFGISFLILAHFNLKK